MNGNSVWSASHSLHRELARGWQNKSGRKSAGMSLLELIVACGILLILASVAVPLARNQVKRVKENQLRWQLRQMREAIDRYKDASDKGLIQVKAGTEGYPWTWRRW